MSDQQPPEQGSFGQPAGDQPSTPSPSEHPQPQPAAPPPASAPQPGSASGQTQSMPSTPSTPATGGATPLPSQAGQSGPGQSGHSGQGSPSAGGHQGGQGGQGGSSTSNVQAALQSVASDSGGFMSALFDFTFTRFVTPMLVRFVYLLATVALVASWLGFLVAGFNASVWAGLFALVIGPIIVIIYLAIVRMTLEFYLSVVRMSEDIHSRLPQA